jgi:hypothetical protein
MTKVAINPVGLLLTKTPKLLAGLKTLGTKLKPVATTAGKTLKTTGKVMEAATLPLILGSAVADAARVGNSAYYQQDPDKPFKYAQLGYYTKGGSNMDKISQFNKMAADIETLGQLAEGLDAYCNENYPEEELVKQAAAEVGEAVIFAEDCIAGASELLKLAQAMLIEDYQESLKDEGLLEDEETVEKTAEKAEEEPKEPSVKFQKLAEFIEHKKYMKKFAK